MNIDIATKTYRNELEIRFERGRITAHSLLRGGTVYPQIVTENFENDEKVTTIFAPHNYDEAFVMVMKNFYAAIRGEEENYLDSRSLLENTRSCVLLLRHSLHKTATPYDVWVFCQRPFGRFSFCSKCDRVRWAHCFFASCTYRNLRGFLYFKFFGKIEFIRTSPAYLVLRAGDRLIAMRLFLVLGFPTLGNLGGIGAANGHPLGAAIIRIVFIKLIADVAARLRKHMIAWAFGATKQAPLTIEARPL